MGKPSVVPMYIKNGDLPNQAGKNTRLDLCQIVNQHVPGQAYGAQLVHGVWSIWLNDPRARAYMIEKVKIIEVHGRKIDLHDIYPTSKSVPNEKVIFKDIPLSVDDNEIIEYLNSQPGITVKSGVIAARIRDNNNKLTPFYSGDRFVYVNGLFSPALNNTGMIDNNKCRIWHKSQERACVRCRLIDHNSSDTSKCGAYTEKLNILTIRSNQNVLCNFYQHPMRMFNTDFRSAEHCYQWRFMMYIGMEGHAQEILDAPTPAEAKDIASRIPRYLHKDWHHIKLTVMREVLHAKGHYCPLFKSTLIESAGKLLVESTQDLFWASGLNPRLSSTTKPEFYPGKNQLGRVLSLVRNDFIKESLITALTDPDSNGDSALVCTPGDLELHTPLHLCPYVLRTRVPENHNPPNHHPRLCHPRRCHLHR